MKAHKQTTCIRGKSLVLLLGLLFLLIVIVHAVSFPHLFNLIIYKMRHVFSHFSKAQLKWILQRNFTWKPRETKKEINKQIQK